jgi:hypothetical protein
MEAVSNKIQLNQLVASIKSSRITIVKCDTETLLASRYLAIIMMVYSTRRLLTEECVSHQRQVNDRVILTAVLHRISII